MNKYSYTKNGFTFERIDKKQARTAYKNGLTVVFCPCNIRPGSFWGLDMDMNKAQQNCDGIEFEKLVNSFEYYNCNSETGRYTAFYIPVEYVDRFTGEAPTAATLGTVKQYAYKYMEV